MYADKSNKLNGENTLITVGVITNFDRPGKGNPSFYYTIVVYDKNVESKITLNNSFNNGKNNNDLSNYVNKKYFVKFSVEKPKYSELFLEKPVPEDFIYKEGQTWSKIPVDYE